MEIPDFPSNNGINKPVTKTETAPVEPKVIKKIVTGDAIRRKKSLGSRFRELVAPEGKSLYESVVQGVLAPALRDMINDALIRGVETVIYGEPQSTSRRSASSRGPVGSASHISYNRYSAMPRDREPAPAMSRRGRGAHDFGEIEIPTRAQAEAVIAQLEEFIIRFGTTSVADLYEMTGLEADYTDERYGWTSLRGVDIQRLRNGRYTLVLPRPVDIG